MQRPHEKARSCVCQPRRAPGFILFSLFARILLLHHLDSTNSGQILIPATPTALLYPLGSLLGKMRRSDSKRPKVGSLILTVNESMKPKRRAKVRRSLTLVN